MLHIKYPGLLQPGHTTTGGLQKKLSKKTKCLSLLTGLRVMDTTYGPNDVVFRESFPQYISKFNGKPSTLHSIHLIYSNFTGFPFINCLAL